jgi:predicted Zn-dependent peptidase
MSGIKQAASTIAREVLPNGLVVVAEPMPHVHSVSLGIWVRSGSRSEPERLGGIAHFIEHMVFRGTS